MTIAPTFRIRVGVQVQDELRYQRLCMNCRNAGAHFAASAPDAR
jgi:hypothetical protein